MIVEVPVKGFFEENCYFYLDDKSNHGFLIDSGAQAEGLLRLIRENGWQIEKILLTHGLFDHAGAVNALRRTLKIPVCAGQTASAYLLDTKKLSGFCGELILVRTQLL